MTYRRRRGARPEHRDPGGAEQLPFVLSTPNTMQSLGRTAAYTVRTSQTNRCYLSPRGNMPTQELTRDRHPLAQPRMSSGFNPWLMICKERHGHQHSIKLGSLQPRICSVKDKISSFTLDCTLQGQDGGLLVDPPREWGEGSPAAEAVPLIVLLWSMFSPVVLRSIALRAPRSPLCRRQHFPYKVRFLRMCE